MPDAVRAVARERSLGVLHAAALDVWDYDRNAPDPFSVGAKSNSLMWWKCQKSEHHRYQKKVYAVVDAMSQGYECCTYCSGRLVAPEESLLATHRLLSLDWDEDRNKRPVSSVTAQYGVSVWWKCHKCSNRWGASCRARVLDPRCKRCSPIPKRTYREKVEAGLITQRKVSLASEYPDIASEWHPEKNEGFTPELAAAKGGQVVWWRCRHEPAHEWVASIENRTSNGSGCPYCSGALASATSNFAVLHPELLREWDYSRNALDPEMCRPGSKTKVHWVCPEGPDHQWEMSIQHRVRGQGCLCCANLKLSVTNSILANDYTRDLWDYGLNEPDPSAVIAGGDAQWYWRCKEAPDHSWKGTARQIAHRGRGCPFCAGKRPSVSNSLASLYPHIAAELDESAIDAKDILAHSHRTLRWRCQIDASHTWSAVVKDRTLDSVGCTWCYTPNTSRREIELASELEQLIGGAWNSRLEGASSKIWACDYANEELRVVVEYDGNRWHDGASERDTRKTRDLEAAGWLVLRVRERGLEPIGPMDFTMPSQWSTRHMTREVVQRLIDGGRVPSGALDGYSKRKKPLGADLAEARLANIRRAQNERDKAAGRAPRQRRRRSVDPTVS